MTTTSPVKILIPSDVYVLIQRDGQQPSDHPPLQRNAADRTRILPILASFPLPGMIH